eukprot:Rmarinus@m.2878
MVSPWLGHFLGTNFRYGYGSATDAETVADNNKEHVEGKTIIVTGSSSGLGFETARVLAKSGAHVVLACRRKSAADTAMQDIWSRHPQASLTFMPLDLASLSSVRRFAEEYVASGRPLHILINNAGVLAGNKRTQTSDGFETMFGTNHLGTFLLTELLLPVLKRSAPSRVVIVSSGAHAIAPPGGIRLDDPNYERGGYFKWTAYGQSKMANLLHARELDRRLRDAGVDVRANAIHPGCISTSLARNMSLVEWLLAQMFRPLYKTLSQGASTQVFVATDPRLRDVGGLYFADCIDQKTDRAEADDMELARRLWELSEKLVHS